MAEVANVPIVQVIYLQSFDIECRVCDRPWSYSPGGRSFAIPIYEGDIVPDGYTGEWGGAPVCPRCYWITRGMQWEFPERHIPISAVRRIATA